MKTLVLTGLIALLFGGNVMANEIAGITSRVSELNRLNLDEGNIAYEDSMNGSKTIICIPGMGDTRGQFRLIAPALVYAGFRVIVIDPRGQGDSDASFERYTSSEVGKDVVKLVDQLGTDVYLIGNSSGGASAAWVAAERPERVKGVVLLGAFLRDHPMGFFQSLGLNLALRGPWATASWVSYYKSLFITNPPADQSTYTQALAESLNQPDHIYALRSIVFSSKADVTERLSEVKAPSLIMTGTKDPDFSNPEEEANWIQSQIGGEKVMVDGSGHYAHLEFPELVVQKVTEFINQH